MTPKQWIKYVRWLEKNNLAVCDGSTAEPASLLNILQTALIIGGVVGFGAFVRYTLFDRWRK